MCLTRIHIVTSLQFINNEILNIAYLFIMYYYYRNIFLFHIYQLLFCNGHFLTQSTAYNDHLQGKHSTYVKTTPCESETVSRVRDLWLIKVHVCATNVRGHEGDQYKSSNKIIARWWFMSTSCTALELASGLLRLAGMHYIKQHHSVISSAINSL